MTYILEMLYTGPRFSRVKKYHERNAKYRKELQFLYDPATNSGHDSIRCEMYETVKLNLKNATVR